MAPHKEKYHLKPNHPSINMSLSFDEDMLDDSTPENDDICSPPRPFGSRLGGASTNSTNTPKMRRLFDTDGASATTTTAALSPFRCGTGQTRSLLNNKFKYKKQHSDGDQLESISNNNNNLDDSTESNCSFLSTLSEGGGARKRSSADRRAACSLEDNNKDNNNMMYTSPRISPNSFITMDGRFVQSKNPFSSPMMTDTPTPCGNNSNIAAVGAAQAALAPALPTSFYSSSSQRGAGAANNNNEDDDAGADAKMPPSFLPPRHHHQPQFVQQQQQQQQAAAALQPKNVCTSTPATEAAAGLYGLSFATSSPPSSNNNGSGYPEHLLSSYKFTGSPIPEHGVRYATTLHDNETATQGSLRKVRRINRSDDVVAATGHHLSHLSTTGSTGSSMSIDTTTANNNRNSNSPLDNDDDISPTDVANFPFFAAAAPPPSPSPRKAPPPTPIKQRPSQHHYQPYGGSSLAARRYYGGANRTPGLPPVLTRKNAVRTPHPGSYLHGMHHDDDGDDDVADVAARGVAAHPNGGNSSSSGGGNNQVCKSRFYSDFDVIGELGKGSFGTVFKVLSRLDGCMYAIKAAQRQAKGAADRGRMLKEVYALAALSDQADTANFHIVRYHQAWMEDDRLYIQTELCSGTVADEIRLRGPLPPQRRYKLLREILLALEFLHRNHMVHLDIKPENIFLKNDQYKLGDFGLVTKVATASCCGPQDVEEGDSRYMSMELLSGDRSDLTKSDIFSLGATMYEICRGRPLPMNGPEWQDLRAGRLSPLPDVDADMAALVQRLMDPVPAHRPAARELLRHSQLLSDEQKALHAEKTKVLQANIQLVAAQQQQQASIAGPLVPPPPLPPGGRRPLQRANTWSGTSFAGSSGLGGASSIMPWL